jgi:hypothetical protein
MNSTYKKINFPKIHILTIKLTKYDQYPLNHLSIILVYQPKLQNQTQFH